MKKKAIIFGCGYFGLAAYCKLCNDYNIMAWTDNNQCIWNSWKEGIPVIKPSEAFDLAKKDVIIFVAMKSHNSVEEQLISNDIRNYYLWNGFSYNDIDKSVPLSGAKINKQGRKSILFVQETACIRTHKIASGLKKLGCKVYLAYLMLPPEKTNLEYSDVYDGIIPIMSENSLRRLVNSNSFDFIHSSNEPDYLTSIIINSSVPVFHDCHDLSSAYMEMSSNKMAMEYYVYSKATGVVFTSEEILLNASKQYGLSHDRAFVVKNYISEELIPVKKLKKLSETDGRLHCVYEGGLIAEDKMSHRYLENIFKRIADEGIQVHFYSQANSAYCKYLGNIPNIHYEGNKTSKELSVEMTKYDLGICILNVTEQNRMYLESASPNKISEYVNAGIPVAVGDIESQKKFVENYGFGKQIILNDSITDQFSDIKKIKIKDNALRINGLTMESQMKGLLDFYNHCSKKQFCYNN